jgi:myo-inositol-1(or 4)-monophosphatase
MMSRRIDPQRFLDTVLPVVRQCAAASRVFYGEVADVGKKADASLTGKHAQQASSVLTVLDAAFQELILGAVHARFPDIRCIAEEKTPMRRAFAGNDSDYVVILDPIDGTLHFQRGDAPYHVCVGLAHRGRMIASAIARPSEDKLFTAIRGGGAFLQQGKRRARRLVLPRKPRTNDAFISTKARPFQQPARLHLDPRESPIGAALVLTQLAEGTLAAYLTRQVEIYDVGPPSLIAEEAGAACFLAGGEEPNYDRRRKFPYYMAAASSDTAQFLQQIQRDGARAIRAKKGPIR